MPDTSIRHSGYCRDYGGTFGLTCGYWAQTPQLAQRHLRYRHTVDEPVYFIERNTAP